MKKNILSIVFLFAGITATIAQQSNLKPPPPPSSKCDSLSVSSVVVNNSISRLAVTVYNTTDITVDNPIATATLEPNPYIKLSTTADTVSVLNPAGINGGATNFFIVIDSLMPSDSVPLNTVFTGQLHMADQGDSIIFCDFPFTFIYGTRVGLAVNEIASAAVYVMVNADQLTVSGDIQNTNLQILNLSGQLLFADNKNSSNNTRTVSIANLPAGMYFLTLQKDNERIVRKFLKD